MTDYAVLAADTDPRPTPAEALLDLIDKHRPAWRDDAACRGQIDVMWPKGEYGGQRGQKAADYGPALALCARCPVRAECAEAGADEHDGVWGGIPKRGNRRTVEKGGAERVVSALSTAGRPLNAHELAQRCGVTVRSAHRWITELDDRRVIDPAGGGRWRLAHA